MIEEVSVPLAEPKTTYSGPIDGTVYQFLGMGTADVHSRDMTTKKE
jgi:hypothetical protein